MKEGGSAGTALRVSSSCSLLSSTSWPLYVAYRPGGGGGSTCQVDRQAGQLEGDGEQVQQMCSAATAGTKTGCSPPSGATLFLLKPDWKPTQASNKQGGLLASVTCPTMRAQPR